MGSELSSKTSSLYGSVNNKETEVLLEGPDIGYPPRYGSYPLSL